MKRTTSVRVWFSCIFVSAFWALTILSVAPLARASANRSTYIPFEGGYSAGDYRSIAFDPAHNQIFVAVLTLSRVDVLSAVDYHTIRSITVPSPSSLDISPDGSTLAVATSSAHIAFFSTSTFEKVSDIVFPNSALGVTSFVYMANGGGLVRAIDAIEGGGGITAYWDHASNSFSNLSDALTAQGIYQVTGPLARSGDYSRLLLGDVSSGGSVQFIDGKTAQPIQKMEFDGYIDALAVNKDASRYAICVEPPAYAPVLVVLDSTFNEIYQDANGCRGMTFSQDGSALYRDTWAADGHGSTQSINMTTFAIHDTANYPSSRSTVSAVWQAADATGMVYGSKSLGEENYGAFLAIDTKTTATPAIPPVDDSLHIVRVIDNIGSAQGGDTIRILCTGVDYVAASQVSVTIGGVAASNPTISNVAAGQTLTNLRLVMAKTPAGASGLADVVLRTGGGSDTAAKGFQYTRASKLFPFSTSPNYLLYDSVRKKLYASHKDQVEVIDPITQSVLAPIIPAGGKLPNSHFGGLSLSPDGKRLYIADAGASLIHQVDPDHPGAGTSIDPAKALGAARPVPTERAFETASGRIIASNSEGNLLVFDPKSNAASWLGEGSVWSSSNSGANFLIAVPGSDLVHYDWLGTWSDSSSKYTRASGWSQGIIETAANEDGTVIGVGGTTSAEDVFPQIVDFNLNSVGYIMNRFGVDPPIGTPSFVLHPSGALLYQAGWSSFAGGGSVEILDTHQWKAAATMTFPENFIKSRTPFIDHMLAIDDTGRYFFGVTDSGITMMVLDTLPLSIGNIKPAFGQSSGGQSVTLRGSGFQASAVASFGGIQGSTTFVDENTLRVILPSLPAGWQDVTVANSNGTTYTASQLFQVLGGIPTTPAITGFSPSRVPVEPGIPGFDKQIIITIVGSGFDSSDTVNINGLPTHSAYIDSSHLQATIPANLSGKTGSVAFTVISPLGGSSNTASVPLVNPLPVIHSITPLTVLTGSATADLTVYGTGFVAQSVVQWNGQNMSTYFTQGKTGAGDLVLTVAVPGSRLATAGTVALTVLNPALGGGVSNATSLDISAAHPVVAYPASVNFGPVLVGTSAMQTLVLSNHGTGNFSVSSVIASGTQFTAQTAPGVSCSDLAPGAWCNVQVQFAPTAVGNATATVTITDNTAGSPHSIPITGVGTQTLVPTATITKIDSLGLGGAATIYGTAVVGGTTIPATAWVEYGTDSTLTAFTKSATTSLTGDGSLSTPLTGLSGGTLYAARIAVQTSGGTGKSAIRYFSTMAAVPFINLSLAPGTSNIATVSAGQTASYQLTAWNGGGGYNGTAALSCSGAPSGATCRVTPSTINVSVNEVPFAISITTTAPATAHPVSTPGGAGWALGLLFGAGGIAFRKRLARLNVLFCLAILTMFVTACGGSGSGPGPGPAPIPGTPAGSYSITVVGDTGGAKYEYSLTLIVK